MINVCVKCGFVEQTLVAENIQAHIELPQMVTRQNSHETQVGAEQFLNIQKASFDHFQPSKTEF